MFYGAKPTGNAGSTSADMHMLQDEANDFQCGREGLLNFSDCTAENLSLFWIEESKA